MSSSAVEPERLIRDVLLRDGSTLRLQAPTVADFDAINAFYEGLSPRSRYLRFHGFGRVDTVARAAVDATGVDRLVLIGRHGGRVVAVASYEGLREPGVAEVAFAVADPDQQRGIGTRMLEQLAAIASERGIRRFDAYVLAENRAMLSVFSHAGFAVRRQGFGEVTVSLDITPSDAVRERIDERDHFAAVESLRPILAPDSVAVMTATAGSGSLAGAVLTNIVGGEFRGAVRAVSDGGRLIGSAPKVRSLDELEAAPDLVVIAAAGDELRDLAAAVCARGARALLVLPDGPEHDAEKTSRAEEEQLLAIIRDGGLRMVGPNSLGVLNTASDVRLNATFTAAYVRAGPLAICSQSGAVGIGLLAHAAARGLGISTFASLGNRADVSTNDLLEWWDQDERTAAIILYVDTFGNPEHFTRIARRVSRSKPILALNGRRSNEPGPGEASSQTATALRGDTVVDALFHQAGVLRFRAGEELFNAAEFFERQPLPNGRRIGILSNSAGVARLAADACAVRGLEVRDTIGTQNPLVLGVKATPDDYAIGIRRLLEEAAIDAVMGFYVDVHRADPAAVLSAISDASDGQPKPVAASVVRSDGRRRPRTSSGVPNFLFPESCADVLARAAERREWLSRPLGEPPQYLDVDGEAARTVVETFLDRDPGGGWLSISEAEALLATHGIPLSSSRSCVDVADAIAAADEIGDLVVLKANLAAPADAGDIDGVLHGLDGETAIRSAWQELERRVRRAKRKWNGAIVQRGVASGGADILVGALRDPDLGPVLAVGLGGRQAGLGRTAAFRLLPTTDADADELIDSSHSVVTELDGFRGSALLDRAALRDLILRFALLLKEAPEVVEADLNPVRCMTSGCVVLDMRWRLERRSPVDRIKTW
jgi:acyl-CoA synthetase (NDP forming)/RimJ/RimL family protein N-acetyltransferase